MSSSRWIRPASASPTVDVDAGAVAEVERGEALGVHAAVGVVVQRQHEVGARVVGERRALGLRRAGVLLPGEHRVHARGAHPADEAAGEVPHQVGLRDARRHDAAIGPAVTGVDDDPLAAQPRAGLAQQLLLAHQVRAPAR